MPALPLLLIHAFPLDSRLWRPQLEAFGASHTVLAPDLGGFGRNRSKPFPDSVDQHAIDLISLLDDASIPRAVVVGLSLGGYIAFALSRLAPERVAGLMLCDTKAAPDTADAKQARTARMQRVRSEGVGFLAQEMIPSLLAPQAPMPLRQELERIILEQDPQGVECALAALRDRPDSTPHLGSLQVPCSLVCGELDTLTPPSVLAEMARTIPDACLVVLSGAGHLSNLESPGPFNEALRALLKRAS